MGGWHTPDRIKPNRGSFSFVRLSLSQYLIVHKRKSLHYSYTANQSLEYDRNILSPLKETIVG
jgi:hypothetical protein